MLRAGVTIGCAAALLVAAFLSFRLRLTRRTPSPLVGSEPFGERLAVTTSRASGMLLGAYLSGLLTIGAGGRLMMRVLAATSSDDVQGLRTEADEVIGEVSLGGTLFLVGVFGVAAGVIGLAFYASMRRWLPDRSLAAGLVGVAIGAGLLVRPSDLINAGNRDFTLVAPVGLAVAFCVGTLVLFGTTFGVLVDHLAPRWPRPGWSPKGVASVLPFAFLLLTPPLFAAAVLGLLAGTAVSGLRSPTTSAGSEPADVEGGGARLGRILLLALGGLGSLSVGIAAGEVLAL